MRTSYAPESTMRQARARYFEVNHFGDDGGYGSAWVDFKLGSIPFPFPNTPARVKAVRFHDLHHVITAYDTDTLGEFEISAWELAAGCKAMVAAWMLNLMGLAAGVFAAPKRVLRAFVRGRHSRSLYGLDYEPLLEETVASVRVRMGTDADVPRARVSDVLLFLLASATGLALGLAMLPLFLALVPVGLFMQVLRKRQLGAVP
ncbi:MAG: hypothetical protein JST54_19420 [Deltaproteobacteria bacterium]|nr:hypothetical protein [Deltaproteobacteria bacterium]